MSNILAGHRAVTDLPAPRLQLRWAASDRKRGYQWECHYELVLPLGEHDIRRENYDIDGNELPKISELIIAMKEPSLRGGERTPCTTGLGDRYYDDPYRDGAHAFWDSKLLGNPPIFVIAPDGMAFARPDRETAREEKTTGGDLPITRAGEPAVDRSWEAIRAAAEKVFFPQVGES